MNDNAGSITLITGAMASGKSTVAQALAERIAPSVHVRGDAFRRMIVSGRAEMGDPLSDEAIRQLALRYALAAQVATGYAAAGFHVFYQDIILGDDLARVAAELGPWLAQVVVLCPSVSTLERRDQDRGKTGYGDWTASGFDTQVRATTYSDALWLDTTELSVEESVVGIEEDRRRRGR